MSVRRLSLLLLSCLAVSARGEVFDISAIISASQEVPSPMGVPASAGGFASVQLDDVTKELSCSDEFESQLLSGQWYLNIHTAANGSGEIRGQVVPEPGAFILSWMGILACVALRRHRLISRSNAVKSPDYRTVVER